jgi:hypothetical protein
LTGVAIHGIISHALYGNEAIMKIIKGLLEEELKKAVQLQEEYEKAMAALPRGVLVQKFVKGYQYYYLMTREDGKVRFEYKGKLLGKDIKQYETVKKDRARYRTLLAAVKKRITFLRRTLQGKELRGIS